MNIVYGTVFYFDNITITLREQTCWFLLGRIHSVSGKGKKTFFHFRLANFVSIVRRNSPKWKNIFSKQLPREENEPHFPSWKMFREKVHDTYNTNDTNDSKINWSKQLTLIMSFVCLGRMFGVISPRRRSFPVPFFYNTMEMNNLLQT